MTNRRRKKKFGPSRNKGNNGGNVVTSPNTRGEGDEISRAVKAAFPAPYEPGPAALFDAPESPALLSDLETARTSMTGITSRYHGDLREQLVEIYRFAAAAQCDKALQHELLSHRDWNKYGGPKPKITGPADILRVAIRFAVGFEGENATKAASRYSRALAGLFSQAVPAEEALERVKQVGGFDQAARLFPLVTLPTLQSVAGRLSPEVLKDIALVEMFVGGAILIATDNFETAGANAEAMQLLRDNAYAMLDRRNALGSEQACDPILLKLH